MFKSRKFQSGVSLVELMVASGILSIVMLGVLSLNQTMSKSVNEVHERLAIADLEKSLVSVSRGKNLCAKEFSDNQSKYTYNAASFPPASISLDAIHLNPTDATGLAEKGKSLPNRQGFIVRDITLTEIAGSGTSFTADLKVFFDSTIIQRPPVVTKVNLEGQLNGPSIELVSCWSASADRPGSGLEVDTQALCESFGGIWVSPGNGRPDYCVFAHETLEWF